MSELLSGLDLIWPSQPRTGVVGFGQFGVFSLRNLRTVEHYQPFLGAFPDGCRFTPIRAADRQYPRRRSRDAVNLAERNGAEAMANKP